MNYIRQRMVRLEDILVEDVKNTDAWRIYSKGTITNAWENFGLELMKELIFDKNMYCTLHVPAVHILRGN